MIGKLNKRILGLDIRSDTVCTVLVKSTSKGVFIENKMYIEVADSMKGEASGLLSALKLVTSEFDLSGVSTVVSLPFDNISFRNLEVPFKEKKKVRQILPFEMEAIVPFSTDDLIIDFQNIGNQNSEDSNEIITGSVNKSELESFLNIIKSAGIDPEVVTIGGCAAANVLASRMEFPENWALLDMEHKRASIYLVFSEKIKAIRSFPVADKSVLKTSVLGERILHTFIACKERFGEDVAPQNLYVTGCNFKDDGLNNALEQKLRIPVNCLDLIRESAVRILNPQSETWDPDKYDSALALCLAKAWQIPVFNFRRGPFATKKFWEENFGDMVRSGIFAAAILFLLCMNFFIDTYSLNKKVNIIDNQIKELFASTFPDVKTIVDPLQQMKIKIQDVKKSSIFTGETRTNVRAIDILNEISTLIPKEMDVKFSKIVIGGGSILISGSTSTFNLVDDMKSRLENAKDFTSVTITSANLDRSGNRVEFKLKIQLGSAGV